MSNVRLCCILYLLLITNANIFAQSDSAMIKSIIIGDSSVQIIQDYGKVNDKILFINVHEDEQTSIDAVNHYASDQPLHFVRLKHNETRRIDFTIKGKAFSVVSKSNLHQKR